MYMKQILSYIIYTVYNLLFIASNNARRHRFGRFLSLRTMSKSFWASSAMALTSSACFRTTTSSLETFSLMTSAWTNGCLKATNPLDDTVFKMENLTTTILVGRHIDVQVFHVCLPDTVTNVTGSWTRFRFMAWYGTCSFVELGISCELLWLWRHKARLSR